MCFDYRCQSVDFHISFDLQAAEEIEVEVSLSRVDGSLGFNIMGGAEVLYFVKVSWLF